jgi:hypothetical protein
MTLERATFVPYDRIQKAPVTHAWSDWNPYSVLGESNSDTELALAQLTDNACIAYAAACAEWVVGRFALMLDDSRPWQFLEACWAYEMSDQFRCPPESNEAEWKGPIRGPIDLALMTVLNTAYAVEDESAHIDAAFAELIPLHVIADQSLFLQWREQVLPKLRGLAARESVGRARLPVPREALDPRLSVTERLARELAARFLARVDPSKNPFLVRIPQR